MANKNKYISFFFVCRQQQNCSSFVVKFVRIFGTVVKKIRGRGVFMKLLGAGVNVYIIC